LAICKGEGFGPWPEGDSDVDPPRCLYLDTEMVPDDTQSRLRMMDWAGLKSELLIYSDAFANSIGVGRARLDQEEWRDEFKRFLIEAEVKLIVLDNIASLTGALDENSRQDWAEINSWLLDLKFAGISTILLHHTGKSGSQRGTSSREDNVDTSIMLERPKNYRQEDGCRFIVRFTKSRVAQKYLNQVKQTEFKLELDEAREKMVWTFKRQGSKDQILSLAEDGMTAKDIAKEVGVTLQYVYSILNSKKSDYKKVS